jgi:hypothetical protein
MKVDETKPTMEHPPDEATGDGAAARLRSPWATKQVLYPSKEGEKRSKDARKNEEGRCTRSGLGILKNDE